MGSTYTYIVRTCFIHYDNSNTTIQKAAEDFLKEAAKYNKKEFLEVANGIKAFQHPVMLSNLIEYVQTSIQ